LAVVVEAVAVTAQAQAHNVVAVTVVQVLSFFATQTTDLI
jgi:hypothetical protein